MPDGCIRTCYCNKFHRLDDGVPLNHKCRVLPPGYLQAEKVMDLEGMLAHLDGYCQIVLHDGENDARIADDDEPPRFSRMIR